MRAILLRALAAFLFAAPLFAADAPAVVRPDWEATETLWESGPYAYDSSGNVWKIGKDDHRDVYVYDRYGRLSAATAKTPVSDNSQSFEYDRYGNLKAIATATASGSFRAAFGVTPGTNRLDGPCAPPYDLCHQRVYDPDTGAERGRPASPAEYSWDALGMMKERAGDRHERHIYDANDERIATITVIGTQEASRRYTLRGADNKVARELTYRGGVWTLDRDYVYRGGTLLASFTGASTYPDRHYHPDHLGSTRVVTDADGYRVAIHTYLPFGREAAGSEPDSERLKFTGHERDSSGPDAPGLDLDYMHARFYDPNGGRFLTMDPVLDRTAATKEPQRWNRYTYVINNPLRFIDPDGRQLKTQLCDMQTCPPPPVATVMRVTPENVERTLKNAKPNEPTMRAAPSGPTEGVWTLSVGSSGGVSTPFGGASLGLAVMHSNRIGPKHAGVGLTASNAEGLSASLGAHFLSLGVSKGDVGEQEGGAGLSFGVSWGAGASVQVDNQGNFSGFTVGCCTNWGVEIGRANGTAVLTGDEFLQGLEALHP